MQKLDTYRPLSEVKNGNYQIKVGDPVFFDRSRPNEPHTAWFRHIGFVLDPGSGDAAKFTCISGNSLGKWRITHHHYHQPALLGFGEYSSVIPAISLPVNTPWDQVNIQDLAPLEDTGQGLDASDFWDLFSEP
jgi:hypothetical protein